MDLGGRKLSILKIIIDDYILTGQPVGSRTISKKPDVGVSSATVRNEMADLEELGYLLQPHTSAGRIPSDVGYRLYVDLMCRQKQLADDDKKQIKSLLFARKCELEDIIRNALKIISDMTGLVTVISLPLFKKSKLQNMKLIKVNESKVLLIIISDTGVVKNISLSISGAEQEDLDVIAAALLDKFSGTTIESISVIEIYKLRGILAGYSELIDYLIPILRDSLKDIGDYEIYVEGKNNVFEMSEFSSVDKAKKLLAVLSDKNALFEMLSSNKSGFEIRIGEENANEEFKDMSVVLSPYKFNGKDEGRIAIIGPTRMDYDRVVSTIEFAANTLSHLFSGIEL